MDDPMLNEASRLLDAFSRVKRPPPYEQTILEIAGYAHYEIVASNLLKFFLQPKENHGLKTAVLESLLAANREIVSDSDLEEIKVDREVHTVAGKSIDLLIETASLVIAVENKLFAKQYNDFAEYARFTQSIARDSSKKAILILLTLNKIDTGPHLAGFNPVIYEQFIDRLLHKIKPGPATANTHYIAYLMDFIRTIQNLVTRPDMFKPIQNFIANNVDKIAHLEGELTRFRKVMDENLDNLVQQIEGASNRSLHEVTGPHRFDDSWPERLALCRYWEIVIPKEKNWLSTFILLRENGAYSLFADGM
jgi:hypothetical protein